MSMIQLKNLQQGLKNNSCHKGKLVPWELGRINIGINIGRINIEKITLVISITRWANSSAKLHLHQYLLHSNSKLAISPVVVYLEKIRNYKVTHTVTCN